MGRLEDSKAVTYIGLNNIKCLESLQYLKCYARHEIEPNAMCRRSAAMVLGTAGGPLLQQELEHLGRASFGRDV